MPLIPKLVSAPPQTVCVDLLPLLPVLSVLPVHASPSVFAMNRMLPMNT